MCNLRKIIHIDMDCFYAAIETRDNPKLKALPIAVGGKANQRGVISTCNYIAREFGIHSAMPTAKAMKLCPKLIVLTPRMEHYVDISKKIRMILNEYSPFIEPLSLDEAFLDVSDSKQHDGSATLIAEAIREKIFTKHGLTASAGVAPNKFLAKIASDWNKPDGIFVIKPEEIQDFVAKLPVKKIFGVGKVTAAKLETMEITTCADLQEIPISRLLQVFGSFGTTLYNLSRGIDDRLVESHRERKSISVEQTFTKDISDLSFCHEKLKTLFTKLNLRLAKHDKIPLHKQFVKIKFADFTITTKECIITQPSLDTFTKLLNNAATRQSQPIRLLGIGFRFGKQPQCKQESLVGF